MSFEKLGLKKEVLEILASLKFETPTQVQEVLIPKIKQGHNIVFTARTGSGKTLAYTLGALSRINNKLGLQMMVLVPTRELAIQVGKEIHLVASPLGLSVATLFGGRTVEGDYRTLTKKNQILVATPGRAIQHINNKAIKVGEVRYLVFDESDQMFDEGFMKDCSYIASRISTNAQVVLASATITQKVKEFITQDVVDYEQLFIGEQIPKTIKQEITFVKDDKEKDLRLVEYLKNVIRENPKSKILVFCNTKMKVGMLNEKLTSNKIQSQIMHSGVVQKERVNRLNLFKQGRLNVLVTTDVAARGIHVDSITLVVNYDIPTRKEFFVHRVGRTGRVGNSGRAYSLIIPQDIERYEEVQQEYDLIVKEV